MKQLITNNSLIAIEKASEHMQEMKYLKQFISFNHRKNSSINNVCLKREEVNILNS